jgi:hypothetical protein
MDQADFFPILSWGLQPWHPQAAGGTVRSTLELLKEMKDCGMNLAGFARPEELDLVHEAGLQAFVFDPRASDYDFRNLDEDQACRNIAGLVKEVGDHPAVYGYYIKDEPNAAEFSGLAILARELAQAAPRQLAYINLFPNYATQEQLGTETYDEYVERYVQEVRPRVISYDHYALLEGDALRGSYFANLETIRRIASREGIPFWNIVLSNAHFTYREPDAAGFRFQTFSTLAYGGKGISWFTYLTPEVGNYRLAPLDPFGNRTPTWSFLQSANLQTRVLAPTLMELHSTRVYHFGSVPEGCRPAPASSLVKAVRGQHQEFLVGEFRHAQGDPYIMLVNKDFHHSTSFEVEFNGARRKVERVSPYRGELQELAGENNWLAPGQGVLLRVIQPL